MLLLFKETLFILSFLPLWVSIIFMDSWSIYHNDVSCMSVEYISITIITLLVLVSLFIVERSLIFCNTNEGVFRQKIITATEEKTSSTEYLVSYVVPMFALDFTKLDKIILFLIFFLPLMYLNVRHNNIYINIIMEIQGYRIYKCILRNSDNIETEKIVISKKRLNIKKGESIILKSLNDEYKLDVTEN